MDILHIVRYALFGVVLLFNLIVLAISANLLNISNTIDNSEFVFEGLCVAVSVLTFATVIPVFVIDFLRRGAFTSLVAVELGWVFVLMILWIAAAGQTSATGIFVGDCSLYSVSQQSNCRQVQSLQAFAWLNFIILFGWVITLVTSAAIAYSRGDPSIWTSSVSDTKFFSKGSTGQPTVMGTATSGYPPQLHISQQTKTQQEYAPSPINQQPSSFHSTPVQQSPRQPGYDVAEV